MLKIFQSFPFDNRSLNRIRASMMSPKSLLTNYPNLIQENKYSTTAARPIMLLSIKSPSDDKDSKMPVKPLSATNMDFDVKITGNSDEESSEGSSISDDLQGINGNEVFNEFGRQTIPYKPLNCESRRTICEYIGLTFANDWL
uniref:Uncharacterized protein n=1 Tax=Wuchereria bancrofti TaxID=6293 RepID=A0AAF5PIX4_WUCBA